MLNEEKIHDYFLSKVVATTVYIMNETHIATVHSMMPEEKYTKNEIFCT